MNTKIILSLAIIGAVAAIAVGGTVAYFSDTETSTGNTFTAGKLDLIVDIDGFDQNPLVEKIFDLDDMKPGDLGEKTISLKVDDNPACGFVNIDVTSDLDNTCTEPEGRDEMNGQEDPQEDPTPGCTEPGELNDQVQFAIWDDNSAGGACNNIYEPEEEILVQGPLTADHYYSIGDLPIRDTTKPNNGAKCYGVAYCFGAWKVTPVDGVMKVKCDGSLINNIAQSDSFTGDLIITAQQQRNQYPNGCPPVGELPIVL